MIILENDHIAEGMNKGILRWFGHDEMMEGINWLSRCIYSDKRIVNQLA